MITAKRKVRFSKTILDYFFNLFALRKKPAGHAGNLTAMTLEQLFECSFVTGCGCADQDIICRLRWIHFVIEYDDQRLGVGSRGLLPADAISRGQCQPQTGYQQTRLHERPDVWNRG